MAGKGRAFLIVDSADPGKVSALPASCPRCAADYSGRLYRRSPVRGFRTGFSKLTQLLSKELFYFLPEGDSRKLVIFSDSREEAADLANGVERFHYWDMVREAMYDELRKVAVGEPQLLDDLESTGGPVSPEAWRFAISQPGADERMARLLRAARTPIPDIDDPEQREFLEKRRDAAQAEITRIRQRGATRTIPSRYLFESMDNSSDSAGPGLLIQRLKSLGVNPGGNDVLYQDYKYDNSYRRWTNLFDFSRPDGG